MRHRIAASHFNRDTLHRQALLRNLVRSLVENGHITTTQAKAKVVKKLTDKLVHRAQQNSVQARRVLHQFLGKRDVVNTLVDKIAPAFGKQTSGFVKITKAGIRRGDDATLATLSFAADIKLGSLKAPVEAKRRVAAKKSKPAVKKSTTKSAKPKAKVKTALAKKSPAKKPAPKVTKK